MFAVSDAVVCVRSVVRRVYHTYFALLKAFQRACLSFFAKACWHCGLISIARSISELLTCDISKNESSKALFT